MNTPHQVVIVGGGLGGAKTAESLRHRGYTGTIALIAEEPHLPYERPPLSKDYLAGKSSFDEALVHSRQWYHDNDVDLHLNTRATGIDRQVRTVALADGTVLPYDALVLATGSTPRRSQLPGADAEGVMYLRTREDSERLRLFAAPGRRVVVIGGGWIGLEVAAVARSAGAAVTVLERGHLPLARVLGAEIARVYTDLHREKGVELLTDTEAAEILTGNGHATGVRLEDGRVLDADVVVVGIGAVPRSELARAAGLTLEHGGVAVDGMLRSSDPRVYAVGDIAAHQHPVLGRRVRVEHWATALHQPDTVAGNILGQATDYTELPYFFSDQYELGMEYLGSAPQEQVAEVIVRGDPAAREFIAFWLDHQGVILAVMAANTWDVIDQLKPLLTERKIVEPARLADPSVPLTHLS